MRDSGPEREPGAARDAAAEGRTTPGGGSERAAGDARRALRPRIRPAVDGDARALSRLMASVYEEDRWFVGDGPPRPDALVRRVRGLDPRRELFAVAELGAGNDRQGIVGWIEAHRYAPMRMEHVATFTLAVGAEARGRGVGRALLHTLVPWARRVGVRKLRLDVRAENLVARALYESEGFVVEGIERSQVRRSLDGTPDDGPNDALDDARFEDNVIMARFL